MAIVLLDHLQESDLLSRLYPSKHSTKDSSCQFILLLPPLVAHSTEKFSPEKGQLTKPISLSRGLKHTKTAHPIPCYYPLVNCQIAHCKLSPSVAFYQLSMGQFKFANCYGLPEGKPPFSYGFPMVFLWFTRG